LASSSKRSTGFRVQKNAAPLKRERQVLGLQPGRPVSAFKRTRLH